MVAEFDPRVPIPSMPNARHHIHQRIKASSLAPSQEVLGLQPKIAPYPPQFVDQSIERSVSFLNQTQIPVQHGFRGARVTAPQKRVHIPVKQTIPLPVVELALLLRQI